MIINNRVWVPIAYAVSLKFDMGDYEMTGVRTQSQMHKNQSTWLALPRGEI